jgi:hypothetical protein
MKTDGNKYKYYIMLSSYFYDSYLHIAHELFCGFVAGDEHNLERLAISNNVLTTI